MLSNELRYIIQNCKILNLEIRKIKSHSGVLEHDICDIVSKQISNVKDFYLPPLEPNCFLRLNTHPISGKIACFYNYSPYLNLNAFSKHHITSNLLFLWSRKLISLKNFDHYLVETPKLCFICKKTHIKNLFNSILYCDGLTGTLMKISDLWGVPFHLSRTFLEDSNTTHEERLWWIAGITTKRWSELYKFLLGVKHSKDRIQIWENGIRSILSFCTKFTPNLPPSSMVLRNKMVNGM